MNTDDDGRIDRTLAARLRELADATAVPDTAAMEARLTRAFAEWRAAAAPAPVAPRWRAAGRPAWRSLAAAAVLMVAAAIISSRIGTRPPEPALPRTTAPSSPASPGMAAPPTASPAPSPPTKPRPRPRRQPAADGAAQLSGFVALPEAAALPEFESGRIVRVEVPLAFLPAYGLDVVPDATPTRVEADLLVGQDGLPRAIRLASTMSTQRSR